MVYQNFEHPVAGKYHDGFSIKRARLDFQGHFSSQFDYRLLVDFVGQSGANGTAPTGGQLISPFLVEANITYKPFTWLNVKAGQMIVEFSQENVTQDRNLDLIERSQVVNALVARKGDAANGLVDSIGNQNGRDIGIQLNGSLFRTQAATCWTIMFNCSMAPVSIPSTITSQKISTPGSSCIPSASSASAVPIMTDSTGSPAPRQKTSFAPAGALKPTSS